MREFHKQFPSGQASRYNRFQYQGGLTNQIPPYGLGSYTFPSGGPFVQEDPYEKWRDFCSLYANPGSTQIQLWQFLLELLKVSLFFELNYVTKLDFEAIVSPKYFSDIIKRILRRRRIHTAFNGRAVMVNFE